MPSYLGFDETKNFRNVLLAKTLTNQDGPQNFSSTNYSVSNLNNFSNIEAGAVDSNRTTDLMTPHTINTYAPSQYDIRDTLDTYAVPNNYGSGLKLYPFFNYSSHNLIGIMSNEDLSKESALFKLAALNIRTNQNGPVFARIKQNLERETIGKARIYDAVHNGNTATLINIVTGKEPLVEANNRITVSKTILGKGVDFLENVAGVTLPVSEIPGDYLTNPKNPINNNSKQNAVANTVSSAVNAFKNILGISRTPSQSKKPSDIFIEYMGQGQKQSLYELLSYSKYAPNYTTLARSQGTTSLGVFANSIAQGVNKLLGTEAPAGVAYIGDDRGNDVKYASYDYDGRPVRSSYYLSLLFDPVQAKLFQDSKQMSEGGTSSGKLTWISKKSKNKLFESDKKIHVTSFDGKNSVSYERSQDDTKISETLSTKFGFKTDSILGQTQDLLDSIPDNGKDARTHVANVIDQTSRIFQDGDVKMSRGSAIQYTDKYGQESGMEFCRVWTKDKSYYNFSDTMKRGGNIRKYDGSVMTNPWNLNYAPMSTGKKSFDGSSNITDKESRYTGDKDGKAFYAKKYMFSIENLAWKTSNREGYQVIDLPYSERGPNGGRIMWFPPYDLVMNESNSANWEENSFLGRPEPIYTYRDTKRSGTISFKIVVDHPSILNLLVREYFTGMSDDEADNYINAFFAGCEELDFYSLIRKYSTLDQTDIKLIQSYLNEGGSPEIITRYKNALPPPVIDNSNRENGIQEISNIFKLNFNDSIPSKVGSNELLSGDEYGNLYNTYVGQKTTFETSLYNETISLLASTNSNSKYDIQKLFNTKTTPTGTNIELATMKQAQITQSFDEMSTNYNNYTGVTNTLIQDISANTIGNITLQILATTSTVGSIDGNRSLSMRRANSIVKDFFTKITAPGKTAPTIKWTTKSELSSDPSEPVLFTTEYDLADFGWDIKSGEKKVTIDIRGIGEVFISGLTLNEKPACNNGQFLVERGLNLHSPLSFGCRQSTIVLKYQKINTQTIQEQQPQVTPTPKTIEDKIQINSEKPKKPPIDVMKRIIMKTLSESYYFKMVEDKSPLVFNSLKEKLKYFHPGFHSMTPEGLNSRLTFLHQCIRPGDTIPIKGISDEKDLNARNTSFGPPPICILRIGDFYHSKVIIRDVNITFDDKVWDLNPEGIGVQPMIADVTLQVNFIGGQGLEKPVERLQNALSSNFYANTEMFDERSESTVKSISGSGTTTFTKTFLENLNKQYTEAPKTDTNKNTQNTNEGVYIGELTNNNLSYNKIINEIFDTTKSYHDSYKSMYSILNKKYGPKLMSLLLSPSYRVINTYDIYDTTNTTPGFTVDLLGVYDKTNDLSILLRGLKASMLSVLSSNSISTIFSFDKVLSPSKLTISDEYLNKYFNIEIVTKLDDLQQNSKTEIDKVETNRNELIKKLDAVNYVIKYGKDGKIDKQKSYESTLSGFTYDLLYDEYKTCIDYISDNSSLLYSKLDNSIDFNTSTLSTNDFSDLISVLFAEDKDNILNYLSKSDSIIFDSKTISKLDNKLGKFLNTPKDVKIDFKKSKNRHNKNDIMFAISSTNEITNTQNINDLKILNTIPFTNITNRLNYYKP